MINFELSLGISLSSDLGIGLIALNPELELVSWIFGSRVHLTFYKNLSNQLQEVIDGKRYEFIFSEEEDYKDVVPRDGFLIQLSINSDSNIEIYDIDYHKKVIVNAQELKEITDNWIKFVEVNTKAFATK